MSRNTRAGGGQPRRRKPGFDRGLFRALVDSYARGAIVLVGTDDIVGRAIRAGQRRLTPDGEPSRWSHSFLFGDLRLTGSGARTKPRPSPYIFESDLNVNVTHSEVRNGTQENWLGRWCRHSVEHCAVIDLDLSRRNADLVLATALELVDEQVEYPLQNLVSTWLAIARDRLWRANALRGRRAMYCSSFVRYCYRRAGQDFLPRSISLSNTAPEHLARLGEARGRLRIVRGPKG
ncbi:MAG: hypothetical protein R6X12_07100 [bacterium]